MSRLIMRMFGDHDATQREEAQMRARSGQAGDGANAGPETNVAPIDLVSRIQRIEGDLSPAERRVAAAVAADYDATTRLTDHD